VENSKAILSNRKEYYDNLYKKWRENLINIDRYEKENEKEKLKDLSPEIIDYIKNDILTSELAIHPAYLMEQCKYIIKQIIFDKEKNYEKLIREENLKNPTNKGEDEENEHFIEKLRNYIIYARSKENNITFVNPVGLDGKYTEGPWEGRLVTDPELEIDIIRWLKENYKLFKRL